MEPVHQPFQADLQTVKAREEGWENQPQTPYQRLLISADIPEATKAKLRDEHARLDPFTLQKNIEIKLKKFFTLLRNLNREATKT